MRVRTPGPADYPFRPTLPPGNWEETGLGNRAQASLLADVPVWVKGVSLNRPYFSAACFDCLSGRGLQGLEVFSEPRGRYSKRPDGSEIAPVEYVAQIHVALSDQGRGAYEDCAASVRSIRPTGT